MPRSTGDGEHAYLPTKEHVLGKLLDKGLEHLWPALAWITLIPVARIAHGNWPGGWAALFCGFCGVCVTGVSVKISHTRGWFTKIMTPATVACAFGWLTAADIAGVSHPLTGAWFFAGGTLVTAWILHMHHHHGGSEGPALTFEQATVRAGFKGIRVLSMVLHPRKKTGTLRLPGGKISADDISKQTTYIEGGAGLPPGALIVKPNNDNAARADYTITDPRVLKKGHDWPGPSRPGASIAEPIRTGIWQDGEDVAYVVTNHHLQVMGMTGAAKTTGQGYNETGETITRFDAATLGVDLTKGRQFLGPLEIALHALITEDDVAVQFYRDLHACMKDRGEFLADHGYQRWMQGCGLTHLTIQQEEFPDIYKVLEEADGDEQFASVVKAIRTAGARLVMSLQRSDFTQMPTLLRGQLGKQCFGVESDDDADFGLSAYQKKRNCEPEKWADGQPGMCFLDTKTIPEQYKAMPMRTFRWPEDTGPGSLIVAHAAKFPAAARPLDPVTAVHLGKYLPAAAAAVTAPVMPGCPGGPPGGGGGEPAGDRQRQVVRLVRAAPEFQPDPPPRQGDNDDMSIFNLRPQVHDRAPADPDDDPDLTAVDDADDSDDDVEGIRIEFDEDSPVGQFQGGGPDDDETPAAKASPEQAWDAFEQRLAALAAAGKDVISIEDLIDLPGTIGHKRTWIYWAVEAGIRRDLLRKAPDRGGLTAWKILRPAAVSTTAR
jgi:hypothetical protein